MTTDDATVAYVRYRRLKADATRRRKDADRAQATADRARYLERRAVYATAEAWVEWQALTRDPLADVEASRTA